MTTITAAPHAPISELSRFRAAAPAAAVGTLTPFLTPAVNDVAPVLSASDRGEQAMLRLRHPFAPE